MAAGHPSRRALSQFGRCIGYVAAISLLNSLVISLATESLAPGGRRDATDAMALLPMALTIMPYVVLQVVVAALLIKPLFLWRLFTATAAFLLAGSLLSAGAMRIPWTPFRWIGGWLFGITFHSFALLIPVVILVVVAPRRPAVAAVPPSGPELPGTRELPIREFKWRWYYWDIGLAVVILWVGAMIDPWGILSYLGGLINVPFSYIALLMSVMVIPIALLCPVILLLRMLVIWPRHIRGWRRLLPAWGMVVGAFAVGLILPFRLPIAHPWEAFMAGFERYVQRRVDVPAVQGWLATLKPAPRRPGYAHPDLHVEESDLPQTVARLNAWHWGMRFDDKDRPMVRLSWGSGVMGGWGLVVGDRQMQTPSSDFSRYGEVRETIAPGAYIWYDVK